MRFQSERADTRRWTVTSEGTAWVHVWLPNQTTPVLAARLDKASNGGLNLTYGRRYLARADAIPLDPRELPLRPRSHSPPSGDLHSAIRDASPDAWGRRVLEHTLGRALTEREYLVEAGSDRIGALGVGRTETPVDEQGHQASLDDLMDATARMEAGTPLPPGLELALRRGTSVGGARPKALLTEGPRKWVAKMSSSTDHYPVVRAEHAAMELAGRCGLDVPAVRRVESLGRDVLLVERFDRVPVGEGFARRLMLSALTILQLHESEALLASYLDLAAFIRRAAADPEQDNRELFSRMVLNILVGNTDDHARNHAFFWDGQSFQLTPAHDICPDLRAGRTAYLAMAVGADGRRASLRNALSESSQFGLSTTHARSEVDRLVDTVRIEWPAVAELSKRDCRRLEQETVLGPGCFEGWPS
jgi:serine/threonine-protein kinase HipA